MTEQTTSAAAQAAPAIAAALSPAPIASRTLRDGRVLAVVRRATVRDMLTARRVVRAKDGTVDEGALEIAILASCLTINGAPARFEDVQDVELGDLMALSAEGAPGVDFTDSPAGS